MELSVEDQNWATVWNFEQIPDYMKIRGIAKRNVRLEKTYSMWRLKNSLVPVYIADNVISTASRSIVTYLGP